MKRKITAFIAALLLLVTIGTQIALAAQAGGEPLTGESLYPEIRTTDESQEESPQDAPTVEVSDYDTFMTALSNAQDGDIIVVIGEIHIPASSGIFGAEKGIILRRGTSAGRFVYDYSEDIPESIITGFTFDGAGLLSGTPFVSILHNTTFRNANFINCNHDGNGAAVGIESATVLFTDCRFENNIATFGGGHITINSNANVTLDGCTLIDGHAGTNGGAIQSVSSTCSITATTITGNTADGSGGGMSTTGEMTITNSKVYANTAKQGGADIANGIWGNLTLSDSIETLTSIFEADGIVPIGWIYDYTTAPITVPGKVEAPQFVPLKMAFEETEEPPVAPDPTPTPDPEPEPTPDPTPEPTPDPKPEPTPEPTPDPEPTPTPTPDTTPSTPPSGGHTGESTSLTSTRTPKPKQEVKTPLLTCGNAVLDVSRRDYLLGCGDSLAGRETHIKRSQAVTVIFRLLTPDSLKKVYSEQGKFLDVSKDDWCSIFVNTLQNAGVIKGCGGDMFAPERNLTRGEMVTLFTRFVEPRTDQSIQIDHWSADAIRTAASLKWYSGSVVKTKISEKQVNQIFPYF